MPYSFDYQFPGFGGCDSVCRLTLGFTESDQPAIVCSQKIGSVGTSITNAVEIIANNFIIDLMSGKRFAVPRETDENRVLEKFHSMLMDAWKNALKKQELSLEDFFKESGLHWVEHYPAGTGILGVDTFTEVTFISGNRPEWDTALNSESARETFGMTIVGAAQS